MFRKIFFLGVYAFAFIGFSFTGMFFAICFQWTNVAGAVDAGSDRFEQMSILLSKPAKGSPQNASGDESIESLDTQIVSLQKNRDLVRRNLCSYAELTKIVPGRAASVWRSSEASQEEILRAKMLYAVASATGKESEFTDGTESCVKQEGWKNISEKDITAEKRPSENVFVWVDSEEWKTIRASVVKDKAAIEKAGQVTGIEPRLLVSSLIVEQLRLMHAGRELFKKFFEPLKILGNANKISLGVMGIKEATAIQIEQHLKDTASPYYLGPELSSALDYEGEATGDARFARLTSEANHHYYSYLYGALYLKQMLMQWDHAGYPIVYRPEIVGTLYNVGFPQSRPNAHPKVGGSQISIADRSYSFGRLSYEFYYSEELLDQFPFVTK